MVLIRAVGLLGTYLYKNDVDGVARIIDDILKEVPEDLKRDVKPNLDEIREAAKAGRWDDAWDAYQVAVDKLGALDPTLSSYVTKETHEAYHKAAEPEETTSYYARKVLEGERSPAALPDGARASERVFEALGEAEVDWERELAELTKPVEVEWEKGLAEYLGGSSTYGSPAGEGSSGSSGQDSPEVYEPLDKFIEELKGRYPKERYPGLYDLLEDLRDEMIKVASRAIRGQMSDTLVRMLDYASVLERIRQCRELKKEDYDRLYALSVEFCDFVAGVLREATRGS